MAEWELSTEETHEDPEPPEPPDRTDAVPRLSSSPALCCFRSFCNDKRLLSNYRFFEGRYTRNLNFSGSRKQKQLLDTKFTELKI